MSQYDFGNIDPATKSGDQLATDLNNWRNALNSLHKGATRPTYAQAGTVWIDDHASPWAVKLFSGSADVAIGTIDPTSGAFVAANSDKLDGKDASAFATAADGALARAALPATGTAADSAKLGGQLPSHYQAALGYTPPRQSYTGIVSFGWNGQLTLTVDSTNFGADWPIHAASAGNVPVSWLGSLGAGGVGTYAYLLSLLGSPADPGTIISGSQLLWSNATGDNGGAVGYGSWRAMGHANASGVGRATVFLRVS